MSSSLCKILILLFSIMLVGCSHPQEKIKPKPTNDYSAENAWIDTDWLLGNMNGYSRKAIAEELKSRGYDDKTIKEISDSLENEDFSGEANMQIGLLKKSNYTIDQIEEILIDLGFEKRDYEKILESERMRQ